MPVAARYRRDSATLSTPHSTPRFTHFCVAARHRLEPGTNRIPHAPLAAPGRARVEALLTFRMYRRCARLSNMCSKHQGWTDRELLGHNDEIDLLRAVAAGRVTRGSRTEHISAPYLLDGDSIRLNLAWLARQDLVTVPLGAKPQLLPRGRRLLQIANGEIPLPDDV